MPELIYAALVGGGLLLVLALGIELAIRLLTGGAP